MKKYIYLLVLLSFTFYSCDNMHDGWYEEDNTPPAAPRNIYVMNGDNRVDIEWDRNGEGDLAGYGVYYSYSYDGEYTLIATTTDNYFVDYEAVNGDKYYYAVMAYDDNGNESDLSKDVVYAAPRPEGYNQAIFDYINYPNNSGYAFSEYQVVPYDDLEADFYFENYNGTFYLDVWSDTDIQDLGQTRDIYDIPFAPETGWSETGDVIAKPGHTYVIWTWDNHYAKVRVKSITGTRIVFDWSYQLIEGERLLKNKNDKERQPLTSKITRTKTVQLKAE